MIQGLFHWQNVLVLTCMKYLPLDIILQSICQSIKLQRSSIEGGGWARKHLNSLVSVVIIEKHSKAGPPFDQSALPFSELLYISYTMQMEAFFIKNKKVCFNSILFFKSLNSQTTNVHHVHDCCRVIFYLILIL